MCANPPALAPRAPATPSLSLPISRARHDLHNTLGHILGFAEMLLELAEESGGEKLRPELDLIRQIATQMISRTNETLDAAKIEAGRSDLGALQTQLDEDSARIVTATNTLARKSRKLKDESFKSDLSRITAAARQT